MLTAQRVVLLLCTFVGHGFGGIVLGFESFRHRQQQNFLIRSYWKRGIYLKGRFVNIQNFDDNVVSCELEYDYRGQTYRRHMGPGDPVRQQLGSHILQRLSCRDQADLEGLVVPVKLLPEEPTSGIPCAALSTTFNDTPSDDEGSLLSSILSAIFITGIPALLVRFPSNAIRVATFGLALIVNLLVTYANMWFDIAAFCERCRYGATRQYKPSEGHYIKYIIDDCGDWQ